jgi:hypothetical protein
VFPVRLQFIKEIILIEKYGSSLLSNEVVAIVPALACFFVATKNIETKMG